MKVDLQAMCSECYQPVGLVLTEESKNIRCPVCGHEVPMIDKGDFQALAKDQSKRKLMALGALASFLALAGGFVWYITEFEKGDEGNPIPGIALMVLAGCATLFLGWVAGSRRYVCEF
jgi:DNA-directed RNA polymerase subunit RPC12/RpoP